MTDRTMPDVVAKDGPNHEGKMLGVVVLGLGGAATFGWLAFLGWAMISLVGGLTG